MIGYLLAYGPTYFVIFAASLLVAGGFLYHVSRSLRTGRTWVYRGRAILRKRRPTAFRMAVLFHALIVAVIVATPSYIVWRQIAGH
jgi:hypothetical protein